MQIVLNMVGEFVAHEWPFLLAIPIFAVIAYFWSTLWTTQHIMRWTARLFPMNARVHLDLGWYLIDKEPQTAEAELKRAISLNPQMREPYYILANLLLNQKDRLGDAEQTVKHALRQFPGDPTGYCFQGLLHEQRESYTEAEKAYRRANAAVPESAWPCVLLGQLLRDKLDNPLGAELAYRQAIRNQPRNWSNYFHLGNLLMEDRRFEEAVRCYEEASNKKGGDAPSLINLGLALVAAQRPAEAARVLPRAVRARPKSALAEFSLGRLFRQLHQPAKAAGAFRRAIRKDADLVDAYSELSRVLDQTPSGLCDAEEVLRQGLQLHPDDGQINYDLSLLLRRMGREPEAVPLLEQILACSPADFDALMGLAAIYKLRGDLERYTSFLEKARGHAPADEPYALACLEAIADNQEAAFHYLEQAVQPTSFSHWWAWEDPDLQFIRDDPRFVEVVGPRPAAEKLRA